MKPSSSPRAANTRAARSREQRENILDAARQSFAERGFHGASMALIAEKAGISVGLIYRYFAGKSELIQGIVEQQMAVLADDLRELEADNRAPVEKVMDIFRPDSEQRRCGRRHLEPALVLEITAEASRDAVIADALERFNQHIDTALGDWLASPVAEGGFGLAPASLPGGILVLRALVDGLKMRQTREGTAFDLKQLQQALAEAPAEVDGLSRARRQAARVACHAGWAARPFSPSFPRQTPAAATPRTPPLPPHWKD